MNKFGKILLGLLAVTSTSFEVSAIGWPADFQGVMLQGFYWDSYSDTQWETLESQADELSRYFKLIWVPNSGSVGGGNNMGYSPVYWFTNHNTCFGTEAQLRSMIATYKAKGVGIIEDVVINHRGGVSNWTNFPSEVWNGQTWHIGLDGICSTDEVNQQSDQQHGTGAADTGDDFNGARDLDHTNANVQNNCKNYCKFLLEDLGYAGFRYDMCKGYSGKYNKIYNLYANPTYSVGEYWDGSYDALAAWIESTDKESAAFDFACKYALNDAYSYGDLTKLCWKAVGTTDQPAGLIHYGYSQLAVTFIDNHDTYRDSNKFTGNVIAANAFILLSPGTPCVFLPHYQQYKSAIQTLIDIRNTVGIHNNSKVTVLQSSTDCYMAEVIGKNGKAVVKIGSAMVSPSGYSNSEIATYGTDYCVWTRLNNSDDTSDETSTTVYFDNSDSNWSELYCYQWTGSNVNASWPGEKMGLLSDNIYSYTATKTYENVIFSKGTGGSGNQTDDLTLIDGALYNQSGLVQKNYTPGGNDPVTGDFILTGNFGTCGWAETIANGAIAMDYNSSESTYSAIVQLLSGNYFKVKTDEAGWTTQYGSGDSDVVVDEDTLYDVVSGSSKAFKVASTYDGGSSKVVFNPSTMKISYGKYTSDIEEVSAPTQSSTPVYYNLQGIRVANPVAGQIYIENCGGSVRKVRVF